MPTSEEQKHCLMCEGDGWVIIRDPRCEPEAWRCPHGCTPIKSMKARLVRAAKEDTKSKP